MLYTVQVRLIKGLPIMRSLVVFTELLAHKGYVVTGHMLVCYDCMALAEYGHTAKFIGIPRCTFACINLSFGQ